MLQCQEKCCSVCCQAGLTNYSVWQSHLPWRWWFHDCLRFGSRDWGQLEYFFYSSWDLSLLCLCSFLPFLSLVYSTCGSICPPKAKKAGIWAEKFLRPTKMYSCFRVAILSEIKPSCADNDHLGTNSGCQSNINKWHLLLQDTRNWWNCWSDYSTVRCQKNTGQGWVGYYRSEWWNGNPGGLVWKLGVI